MTRHAITSVLGATLCLHFGCVSTGVGNPDDDAGINEDSGLSSTEQALVEDGNESLDIGDIGSAIASVPLISVLIKDDILDGATAATRGTRSALDPKFGRDAIYLPSTCVTATAVGNVATFTFTGCDIPAFFFKGVTGTITATYNPITATQVQVSIDSKLTMSLLKKKDGTYSAPIAITQSGSATISFELGVRKQSWNGHFEGTTPSGRKITHDAVYTWMKDYVTKCVEIPVGASTDTIESPSRGLTVSISDYKRCGPPDKCPESGTLVFTDKASGLSVTIRFLGGQAARVTGPVGRAFEITLACKP